MIVGNWQQRMKMADLLNSYFAPNFPEDKGDRVLFSLHRTYSRGLENRKPTITIDQKKSLKIYYGKKITAWLA